MLVSRLAGPPQCGQVVFTHSGMFARGRFAGAGGRVAFHLGQEERQILFVQGHDAALFAVDDGDGFAPVALAAEEPIAELVVDRLLADAALLQPGGDPHDGLGRWQAGELT